ncbi:MAG: hypothetical protein DRJ03_16845 [Chloroflexi bacterium]|nr:MAG: hypothetical protein DRJ03_16845 [Chloroflexota bacterium]
MTAELYKKDDEYLRIEMDPDPINYREETDCNIGIMVCWHRGYTLGDEQPKEDPEEYREGLPKNRIELPLYLYDHSGITMRTTPFSCRWDSGQVGFIYTTPKRMKELGVDVDKAEEYLRIEVEQYDHLITGNVYGFTLFKIDTCENCGNEEEKTIDSCWGFYGDDHKDSGLYAQAGVGNIKDWEEV